MKHIKAISLPARATDWWEIVNAMNTIVGVIVILGEALNTALLRKDI